MTPVIALVGRPNVGKSTLFNRLTRSRDALVADFPGLTRDRKYGNGMLGGKAYTVIDTGGISGDEEGIDAAMAEQSLAAIDEADIVLFLVDARAGLNVADEAIANHLRVNQKKTWLVVNKTDAAGDLALAQLRRALPEAVFVSYMELRNLAPENFAVIEKQRRAYEDELEGILRAGVAQGVLYFVGLVGGGAPGVGHAAAQRRSAEQHADAAHRVVGHRRAEARARRRGRRRLRPVRAVPLPGLVADAAREVAGVDAAEQHQHAEDALRRRGST